MSLEDMGKGCVWAIPGDSLECVYLTTDQICDNIGIFKNKHVIYLVPGRMLTCYIYH